ncbi:MAG: MFS transporter [Nocardioides sp.]|uniref:MFS transporter n=1 Tax=Nocardioides sp. TaxID=35761 RepID=UPI0039E47CB3
MTESLLEPGAEPEDRSLREGTGSGRANLELFIVGLGALAVSMSQTMLAPALGQLNELYGVNANWLLTAPLLVAAVCVPVLGRLGDMFGKRLMLLVALAALTVGSLIDALTSDIGWLIAGRAVQGISSAAVPLGISLVATLMPRHKAASAVAVISAMLGVGGALAMPLAGLIAENWDWHLLSWTTAVAGAIAFPLVLLFVPESLQRDGGRVDVPGTILLSIGLVSLILPLEQSHDWGWTSPGVLGLLIVSAATFAIFVAVETRTREPLVDITALRRRPIATTNLASVCFGFALFASFIGTSTFVEAGRWTGYGLEASLVAGGMTMLPSGLMMLIFSPLAAKLIPRWGAPRTMALGAFIVAAGWLLRIVLSDSLWQVMLGTTITGIGTGFGYATIPTLINLHTPPHEIAAANGLNTLFRNLGSTLATSIGTAILTSSLVYHVVDGEVVGAASSFTAYRWLFAVCAVAALVAGLLVLTIPSGIAAQRGRARA